MSDNMFNLSGRSFNGLDVIERDGTDKHKKKLWRCKCPCGEIMLLASREVKSFKRCHHRIEQAEGKCLDVCVTCGRSDVEFYASPKNRFGRKPDCVECYNAKRRAWYIALKNDVMQHYGNAVCAVCGEARLERLSIDHINGGGYRQMKDRGLVGTSLYSWLRTNGYPPGYQVLCITCNMAKGEMSTDELRQWILRTADYLRSQT